MSSEAQVRLLHDTDNNNARNDRGWSQNRTAQAPRNKIWLQIFCATGLLALFATIAWLFYPGTTLPHLPGTGRNSIKVMVIGDSISQGYEGDYTWRYRLWQWLREADHEDVTFVGPFIGTFPPPDRPRPSTRRLVENAPVLEVRDWGGYNMDVDDAWRKGGNNAHFAHWGRQAAQFRDIIEDAVRQAQPDYVVLALGFNDLAWLWWPTQLIEIVEELITKSRAAKRDIKFAVANVVQRTAFSSKPNLPKLTRMYNELLEEAIPNWRTEESPVELVRMRESYECDPWSCPASHDGLHPNAKGEYQITRAFARTLNEKYGLGSPNYTVPEKIPVRPCVPPTNVQAVVTGSKITTRIVTPTPTTIATGTATATDAATATVQTPAGSTEAQTRSTIHVTWNSTYGAYGYQMQAQLKGGNWAVLPYKTDKSSQDLSNVGLGEDWEMRVRAYCGDQQPSSDWTSIVSVST